MERTMDIEKNNESISRVAEKKREYRNQMQKVLTIPVIVSVLSLAISAVLVVITLSQLQTSRGALLTSQDALKTSQDTFEKAHVFEKLKEAEKLAERLRHYYEEGAKFHALREVSLVSLITLIEEEDSILPVEYNGIVADDFRKRKEYDKAASYYIRVAENPKVLMHARVNSCRYLGQIHYILKNNTEGANWYKKAIAIPVGKAYHVQTYKLWANWDNEAAEKHKLEQNK